MYQETPSETHQIMVWCVFLGLDFERHPRQDCAMLTGMRALSIPADRLVIAAEVRNPEAAPIALAEACSPS